MFGQHVISTINTSFYFYYLFKHKTKQKKYLNNADSVLLKRTYNILKSLYYSFATRHNLRNKIFQFECLQ